MGDSGVPEDDSIMEQIDWEHLLDNTPEDLNFFDVEIDPCLLSDFSNPSPDLVSFSVDEIEQLLMKDDVDDGDKTDLEFSHGFLSDILLDSPAECDGSGSGEVVHVSDGNNSNSSEEEEKNYDVEVELKEDNNGDYVGDADDPIAKKRKRQMRNRDAAVRSRERKKTYVRDLEMKSRYFEGECKRLGMLLQCYLAENQTLRLSLQNSKAFDASMTKQESAVLLLESLLLGSLLWFLGIVCLFILPRLTQSTLEAVPLENVDNKNQGGLAPRKASSKIFGDLVFQSSMIGKRCKASRSRMKRSFLTLEVLV